MELATITMEKGPAREAFLAYRRAVRERHDTEDEQIMRGYRALARGNQLIRLSETVCAGGTTTIRVRDRHGRRQAQATVEVTVPRLAVARAGYRHAWTKGIQRDGSLVMQTVREPAHNNVRNIERFPAGLFDEHEGYEEWGWGPPRIRALVPLVPPPLRPRGDLGNYHILFEAEWGIDPEPPVDPALLKHIGGDLYAVVAVWDLTEVERAVLALRD